MPKKQNIVEDGYLKSLFINYKSALKLGIKRTGHGMGSVAGLPFEAPYNLSIKQGEIGREKMMKDAGSGIIITDTIGHGINYLTGDLVMDFLDIILKTGVVKHPVTNMTVAGNIKDLFFAYDTPK